MSEYDEKTRITQVVQKPPADEAAGNDCVVVIYANETGLLGKRFVLDNNTVRVGRGTDNTIVLEGDSVSRRHAHFECRSRTWFVVDDNSTNGTYLNEERRSPPTTASRSGRPFSSTYREPTLRPSTTKKSTA